MIEGKRVPETVYRVYADNIRKDRDKIHYLATPMAYLFNMTLHSLWMQKVSIRMERVGPPDNLKWITYFTANEVERNCPITNQDEQKMLRLFTGRGGDEAGEVRINAKLGLVYRQVKKDTTEIFKRLGLELAPGTELKALRDLRIADLIINQGVDYGYLMKYGLGKHHRHFDANLFKDEIRSYA